MLVRELELLPDFSQDERTKNRILRSRTNPLYKDMVSGNLHLIARVKSHSIYLDRGPVLSKFYAVDDGTDLVALMVDGDLSSKGNHEVFEINVLQGRKGSKLKAYEFYRAILLNMPLIFVAHQQSYGGMRTWQELSRYPDIEVFGWEGGKAVNVDPMDQDETHASDDDVSGPFGYDPDAARIKRMKLVAHRSIKHGG